MTFSTLKISIILAYLGHGTALFATPERDAVLGLGNALNEAGNIVSPKSPCDSQPTEDKKETKTKTKKSNKRLTPEQKLTKTREVSPFIAACLGAEAPTSFADSISFAVDLHLKDQIAIPNSNGNRKSLYKNKGLPAETDKNNKVSLLSHPMCELNLETLRNKKLKPSEKTVERANLLVSQYNEIYDQIKLAADGPDKDALLVKAKELWKKFFNALAVTETLGGKDDKKIMVMDKNKNSKDYKKIKSDNAGTKLDETLGSQVPIPIKWSDKKNYSGAQSVYIYDWVVDRYDIKNYSKPADVLMYYDFAHKDSFNSRFNVGLFQFSPMASGNISHCIDRWNEDFKDKPNCQITADMKKSTADMIKIIGGSEQAFNSYCGANKILSNFQVQVNTKHTKPLRTHPDNIGADKKIKPSEERCVTLHFDSKKSYNHFGTLHKGGTETNAKGKVTKRVGIDRLFHNMYK